MFPPVNHNSVKPTIKLNKTLPSAFAKVTQFTALNYCFLEGCDVMFAVIVRDLQILSVVKTHKMHVQQKSFKIYLEMF